MGLLLLAMREWRAQGDCPAAATGRAEQGSGPPPDGGQSEANTERSMKRF